MNRRAFLHNTATSYLFFLPLGGFASLTKDAIGVRLPSEAFLAKLPRLMELASLPGLGIGIVRRDLPVWQHYAGVANAKTKTPITPESLFSGCSLGKPIFACLVLKLAEEGRIDLNRSLNSYLQDDALVGQFGDRVTAYDVLSHTTGLPNWRSERDQKLIPSFEPGTQFEYSGEAFYHLQRVVETITGVGLESLMQERIFKPLGMNSTTYLWRADATEHIVTGHDGGDPYNRFDRFDRAKRIFDLIQTSGKPLSFWTHEQITAALMKEGNSKIAPTPHEMVPNVAFSLLTTVGNYTRFLAAFVDPHDPTLGLSSATRAAMQKPLSNLNSALSWGLGIGIEETDGQTYLWQWGDNGGWKDFLLAHPSTRSAIVVFTNGSNGMHVNERIIQAATGVDHPAFLWNGLSS
jgi:CubicO group peptidase (beta-lactamase class C family)